MRQSVWQQHENDEAGNPAGGRSQGVGIEIRWQNGPLGTGPDRIEPNGAFVEGVIEAARGRLEYYQGSKFRCEENAEALEHLNAALHALDRRTRGRVARGVEGTHAL